MDQSDENSTGAKIAVLRNEVKHVNESVMRMEGKMDQFIANSVTQAQLATSQMLADKTHKAMNESIDNLRTDVDSLQGWKDGIVSRIAAGAVIILVGMVLAVYGLEKFL